MKVKPEEIPQSYGPGIMIYIRYRTRVRYGISRGDVTTVL